MQYASKSQAENGTDNITVMTPLRVKDAITTNVYYKILKSDLYLKDGELPDLKEGYYFTKDVYFNGTLDFYISNAFIYYDTSQQQQITITSISNKYSIRSGYLGIYRTYNKNTNTWSGNNYIRPASTTWDNVLSKPIVTVINNTTATDTNIPSALAVKKYIDDLLS